jgi:acyl-CoA thioesterase I
MGESNKDSSLQTIRIACVGDSLTELTIYPDELRRLLNSSQYEIGNFGACGTTVSLDSELPYVHTSAFEYALEFEPNIVIIMLGTNDAQPNLELYNSSFMNDYKKIITSFQDLASKPKIWIVLPPPIFDDQMGAIDLDYFQRTLIPCIKEVANQTNLPIIDVYSALADFSDYFPDGVHPNDAGAKLIANTIYNAIFSS